MSEGRTLLTGERLQEASSLLGDAGCDGWLLYDFDEQDPLAHELLGAGRTTRPAYALVPREGPPILLRHAIEASPWRGWPFEVRVYRGWRELDRMLRALLSGVRTVAMEVSPGGRIPALDRVPAGVAERVKEIGAAVVSSADLITATYARWSTEGLVSHRRAAVAIREIAHAAFWRAGEAAQGGAALEEGALAEWIRARLREAGLTGEDSIVAAGSRAADPHYEPVGRGGVLTPGSLVLVDLWGAFPDDGIPADQTWMGFLGRKPPGRVTEVWSAVRDARDAALAFLEARWVSGQAPRGWEVDRAARETLASRGLGDYFVHRLGHSIDRELHGSGPNLDDLETREERSLIPGIGFSVEPGVYIPGELGVRSEVNVYMGSDGPEVTPANYQRELLVPKAE